MNDKQTPQSNASNASNIPEESSPTRDDIRAGLLGKKQKPKSEQITLFGHIVEIRQPSLEDILTTRDEDDPKKRVMKMLVEYTYRPGTDERLFESSDMNIVMKWPFGEDVQRLQKAITDLTGINIGDAEEELKRDPTNGQ